MARRQTLVQLTDDLVDVLDAIAAKQGRTRSALIRSVLESFVKDEDEAEKDRRMIEGYTKYPPGSEDDLPGAQHARGVGRPRRPRDDRRGVVAEPSITRGEVWWADIADVGRRPVLLMTRDVAMPLLRSVTVATITSHLRGVPTEVVLDESDGVAAPSIVSVDDIRTISKQALVSRVTKLSGARLEEVCEAFRYAVGC